MGVYHLAGLGRSIGAVTAAFSYLAARKELPDAATDPLFELSGEMGEDMATRGAVEALVLFATREIVDDTINCEAYEVNEAGRDRGREMPGGSFTRNLLPRLKEEVRPLARREVDADGKPTGRLKPLELYWCTYDDNAPVATFERVALVMRAASGGPGRVGKEFWVNLTAGRNIINGALQLAASLTGAPARMYYLLSTNTRCIRHTVPQTHLRTEQDHFWVDLPVVYLDFSPVHWAILDALVSLGPSPLTLHELHSLLAQEVPDRATFIHGYLRPLSGQRLLVHEKDDHGRDVYYLGEGWARESRYLSALRQDEARPAPRSLSELASTYPEWFRHERLDLN